ncbi:Hcp family type VI secretion system effector [Pantoea sp. B65]|uniref:Hcp family type VI secretion system effector n=1 Tax=Pantoea sp. B65 TaxID=2813359 RepID=UPI0039B49C52
MSTDMYLKVEGVSGESKDSNHNGWTDITSFSWGATQQGNTGGAVGKVNFSDLHITAPVDKSVTALIKYCATGKYVNKVELSLCRAGGQQIEFLKITLQDVLVTTVDFSGATKDDKLAVTYCFQAAKVRQQYWETTSSGGKGAETSAGWDIKENREI